MENKSARSNLVSSLKRALFENSCETEEHAQRMLALANRFSGILGLSENETDELGLLAILHDIGKVGISQSIVSKQGKLTEQEWEEIKKHPEIGYRIAESSAQISHIAELILYHHERFDGTGYPQGLSREQIPRLSRIIAVIDAFDVMTHERPYKKAISHEQAIEELQRCSGTQFDPKIVKIFVEKMLRTNDSAYR
ncbi:MAG: HD-GYP domain-containing protein [Hyphomonadaceae bacterium]|nr:HD-GYP domain-containing protein [Clostridia bacterium]